MKLIIHRGTHEIGGSCVELCSDSGQHIVLDIGMPLVEADGSEYDWNKYREIPLEQLFERKILPQVEGLYVHQQPSVSAVFLSHAHQDHYGFLRFVNRKIPVYMSEGTRGIIEVSMVFLRNLGIHADQFNRVKTFDLRKKEPINLDDFKITPYIMDHSAPDASAFLIEADEKRLFYTGDFRGHGRKGVLLERLIKNPISYLDCLLMEGTNVRPEDEEAEGLCKDEEAVQTALYDVISRHSSYTFIFCSSQNLDRIISIFKAARDARKTLVIDFYTAYVLKKLGDALPGRKIPQFSWDEIRLLAASHHESKLKRYDEETLARFKEKAIGYDELRRDHQNMVLICKDNSRFPATLKDLDATSDAIAVYSQWSGYLKRSKLKKNLEERGIELKEIHTSGHAYVEDLKRLADVLDPKYTIPIHTFQPDKYCEIFKNVKQLEDGEEFVV
jgi:ribonuclease J